MTELFDGEEEDLILDDPFVNPDDEIDVENVENNLVDARRRLESLLDEKRLREELGDFDDL